MSEAREAQIAEDEARWRAWLEIARWEGGECLEERLAGFRDGSLPTADRALAAAKRALADGKRRQESDRPTPGLSPIVVGGGER